MALSGLLTPDIVPQQESARRKIALQLLLQGSSGAPVMNWAQGLARAAQGALGGYELGQEEAKQRAEEAGVQQTLQNAIRGASGGGYRSELPETPETPAPAPNRVAVALAGQPDQPPTRTDATGSMFGGMPGWAPDERPIDMGPAPTPPVQVAQAAPQPQPMPQPTAAGAPRVTPALSPEEAGILNTMAANKRLRPQVIQRLLEATKPKESFRAPTPEEQARGITAVNTLTNEPKTGPMSVNVSTEKKGQEHLATKAIDAYTEAQQASRESQRRIALYDRFEKAAEGFRPGATAELRLNVQRLAKDLGIAEGKDVPEGELMQMIGRQLAIHAQPKGQGSVSNYERQLYAQSLPNLTQSPEGLKMAIGIQRDLEKFDMRVAQIWRDSARANGGIPNYLEVQDKIAALGSPLTEAQMRVISGSQPQEGSAATTVPAGASGKTKSGIQWRIQ